MMSNTFGDTLYLQYFIAPKTGSIALTKSNLIISSFPFVVMHNANAFMPPKILNKTDFPSITGSAPSGPSSEVWEMH